MSRYPTHRTPGDGAWMFCPPAWVWSGLSAPQHVSVWFEVTS